jgi:hypothetical protein
VEAYTRRAISDHKDKLEAINEIASEIGDIYGGGYRAGIREEDLHF